MSSYAIDTFNIGSQQLAHPSNEPMFGFQCQHHHKWFNNLWLPCDMNMSEYSNSTNPMSTDWFLYQTWTEHPVVRPDIFSHLIKPINLIMPTYTMHFLFFCSPQVIDSLMFHSLMFHSKNIDNRYSNRSNKKTPIRSLKHLCCLHVVVTNRRACDASPIPWTSIAPLAV